MERLEGKGCATVQHNILPFYLPINTILEAIPIALAWDFDGPN